jgi:hypothetical protein
MADLVPIGTMIEFAFTILIYTFVWRENIGYRIAEHVFVGVSAGYMTILALQSIYKVGYLGITQNQNYGMLIAILLGLILYLRFTEGGKTISRWPLAILIGLGTSLAMRGGIDAMFLKQIRATMLPLNSLDNIVIVLGVLTSLVYFFFTVPRENVAFSAPARVGRYVLMVAFGASYAMTISSRLALFIDRLTFILKTLTLV